jgi:hypothetical protein
VRTVDACATADTGTKPTANATAATNATKFMVRLL